MAKQAPASRAKAARRKRKTLEMDRAKLASLRALATVTDEGLRVLSASPSIARAYSETRAAPLGRCARSRSATWW